MWISFLWLLEFHNRKFETSPTINENEKKNGKKLASEKKKDQTTKKLKSSLLNVDMHSAKKL